MGYLRYAGHITTGTATGVAAGGQVNGTSMFVGTSQRTLEHLSAVVTALAETDTITLASKWQVSNDASTWFDIAHEPQNPAAVVLQTGTTGTETAVNVVIPAPRGLYGYKWARSSMVVGVTTGTDDDTWSIGYSYRKLDTGETTDGHLMFDKHIITGNATGVAPGSAVNGRSLFMGQTDQKVDHLSALVTVDAETNTITLGAKWQGSNDASTWVDLAHAPQYPARVALATGTAGADAAVARAIPAPDSVYGYKFARCAVVVGVVTGQTADTYSIGYCYRQNDPGGARE